MTSTIFLTMALVATAIFLIQFIVSIFFGEIDTDVDMDADIGSVISFKGLTHFCIGMGWYMYITQGTEISSYVAGILVGLVFVFVLWFLYKKACNCRKRISRRNRKLCWGGSARSMRMMGIAILCRLPLMEPCVKWMSARLRTGNIRPVTGLRSSKWNRELCIFSK